MTSPQKAKGGSWEREVAKFLSSTYNLSFIRSPGSGAYVGGRNQSRMDVLHEAQVRSFKGDIVPGDGFVNFNVECKSYKSFPFHQLFLGGCLQLDKWIDQLMDVASDTDVNILLIKITRIGKFAVVQDLPDWNRSMPHVVYESKKHGRWVFCSYDQYWDVNTPIFGTLCTAVK